MTASGVSQVNLIPVEVSCAPPAKAQPADDFSELLKNQSTKTEPAGQTEKPVTEGKKTETEQPEKLEKKDTNATERKDSVSDKKVSETEETDKTDETKEPEELTDEELKAALEAVSAMVAKISEVLHVTVEDVQNALDQLGLSPEDVLNPDAVLKLSVALMEGADELTLMTSETAFRNVEELKGNAEDLLKQLSEKLDLPEEDVRALLAKATEATAEEPVKTDKLLFQKNDGENVLQNREIADPKVIVRTEGKEQGKNEHQSAGQNDSQMNFSQHVFDQIKTAVAKMESPAVSYTSTTESIMNQIDSMIKVIQKQDLTEMELQLHPASLGHVKVQLSAKEGMVTANFTAENEAVRAALESQVVVLKQNFEEQGLKVEAVEVTVASHAFEENLSDSEDDSGSETEQKKTHRRKLSLNEIMNADTMDELPEEERVVADMMKRSGNSVDYLA